MNNLHDKGFAMSIATEVQGSPMIGSLAGQPRNRFYRQLEKELPLKNVHDNFVSISVTIWKFIAACFFIYPENDGGAGASGVFCAKLPKVSPPFWPARASKLLGPPGLLNTFCIDAVLRGGGLPPIAGGPLNPVEYFISRIKFFPINSMGT